MIHYHHRKYVVPEIDFSDSPHWKLVTVVWAMVAASVATTATSQYSASAERTQQKKALNSQKEESAKALAFQEKQVADAEAKVKGAEKLAAEHAATTLKKKRAAMTNTILTSPLGITGDANTKMPTLLGG